MNDVKLFFVISQLLTLQNTSMVTLSSIYYILSKKIPKLPKFWYLIFTSIIGGHYFKEIMSNTSNISKKFKKYLLLFSGGLIQNIENYIKSKKRNSLKISYYLDPNKNFFQILSELTWRVGNNLFKPTAFYYTIIFILNNEKLILKNVYIYILNFYRTLFSITMFSTFSFGISELFSKILKKKTHINIFPHFISSGIFLGSMIERKERWRSMMIFILSQYLSTRFKFKKVDKHLLVGYVSYLML